MGSASDLLRLLEPAVRPGGVSPSGKASSPRQPIEARSFESILAEANGADATGTDGDDPDGEGTKTATPPSPLAALGGACGIENASLRDLIGRAAGAITQPSSAA